MDMGASWIHGLEGNPMTALARAAGAPFVETSFEAAMALDAAGEEVDLEAAYDWADSLMEEARALAEERDEDIPLKSAIEATRRWASASPARRRLALHVIGARINTEFGSDWGETSAWYFDGGEAFEGEDAVFPEGYDRIVNHLAEGLSLRLSAPVTAVAPEGAGVSLTLASGEVLQADHALITVPLGVLKDGGIAFATPLAAERQAAIDTIGMGLLSKTWLLFDRIAWPGDVDWIEWVGPEVGFWSQWISLARIKQVPVLLAFHGGEEARVIESLTDSQIMTRAHEALKAMFGADFPAPVAVQTSRWGQDPFARGAYSFSAVGTTPELREALAGADWGGRLFFAGEACDPVYSSTAHAAVLSGRAVAGQITD